ncbi:MAG: hypothetical protein ACK5QH_06850 [Rubrivivax sp.]
MHTRPSRIPTTRTWTRPLRLGAIALALCGSTWLLSGCWEDTGLNPEDEAAAETAPLPVQSTTGGTVEVTSGAIAGAKVVVPADAVVAGENITLNYSDTLPGPLPAAAVTAGAVPLSKVLVLERTGVADFGKSVAVTVPFDKTGLDADAVPVVLYWDESLPGWSPVAVKAVDMAAGKLSFSTAHASKYMVSWIKFGAANAALDPKKLAVALDFNPATDGFFVHNFGTYEEPGGNAFGMAAYAAWYHTAKKKKLGEPGLGTLYKEGNAALEEDDQVARELIARAYQAGDQKAHIAALNDAVAASANGTALSQQTTAGLSLVQQMMLTQQAQVLTLGNLGTNGKWVDGHAVTVYAYDGTNQRFLLYDNNYPGEVVTLPWSPANGFGKDSKNRSFKVFAFASFNSAYSPATLDSLFQAAKAGFPTSLYPKITVGAPAETKAGSNTFEVAADGAVVITGSVPRPASANAALQRYAHVYLNGVRMAAPVLVDSSSNAFSITVGTLPTASGTDVMVLVSETDKAYAGWGSGAAWAGGFHAYKQFKLRVANQYFFQNMGFETGDLTGWASERHVWGMTAPQIVPSDKSALVSTPGFDPIATDLQVPLFGKHAFRVNNEDNNEHISSLTQTAVVPTSKNPVLRFYWSAVLEDPNHSPEDQPYIEIVVTNTTKNIELYRKRYFANDPTYSGWKSYQGGDWVSIPWQLVELPVAQYAGDNIVLKLEAADCALGGHGGYGYIDVDE